MKDQSSQADKFSEVAENSADDILEDERDVPAVPAWLKMLEEQSYQAELLISGLVVAGLFRFPDLIIGWLDSILLRSNEVGFHYLSMAGMLMLSAGNALLFFFGLHFILRSIWVALLGLNSVYPAGINVESKMGSGPLYWRKAKEKYPNLSAYNLDLDRQCSVIFSMASSTFIIVTSISLIVLVVYWIFALLMSYFPIVRAYALPIGIGLYLLFLVFSLLINWLAKKYPSHPRMLRFMDSYGTVISGFFSLYFFRKPVGYITGILTSNTSSKYYFIIMLLSGGVMGFIGGAQTGTNPLTRYLQPDRYVRFNNRPQYVFPFNYENLRDPEQLVFTPLIPSDVIQGKQLKLFIPIIERETEQMDIQELSLIQKLRYSRPERDSIQKVHLSSYAAFNQVAVNDSIYEDLDFQYYEHPQADDKGLLVYIPTRNFVEGRNLLEIRKGYYLDGVQKIVTIPFYYEPLPVTLK